MNLTFNNAWILYFLWIVPAAAIWWLALYKRSTAAKAAFVSPELLQRLFPKSKFNRQLWQTGLVSIAILLLLIAAAQPRWGEREETVLQQARDLVIAVDVSRSMLANDVHPSRLERAKIDLVDLITELHGDRAALIAFRAKASLVCPLTTDYAFLRQALDGISPNSAPRGETDIGAAITKAIESFDEEDASHKAIVLISDGEDLTEKSENLAKIAGEKKIPIYTVGIGSRKGSRIPDQDKSLRYIQHNNKDVITKLDNDTLYAIAKASGGSYIPIETSSMTSTTLGTIYRDHLRNINARDLAETREIRAIERYQWFLFPAIILLLTTVALSRGRLKKIIKSENSQILKSKNAIPLACLLLYGQSLAVTPSAQAQSTPPPISPAAMQRAGKQQSSTTTPILSTINSQSSTNLPPTSSTISPAAMQNFGEGNHKPSTTPPSGRHGARKAQSLFKKGEYNEAAKLYLEAAKGVSRATERTFKHNAAVALSNAGQFKESSDIFRQLSLQTRNDDKDENAALGFTLFNAASKLSEDDADQAKKRAQLLKESGEAFKEAWRNNNDNTYARDDIAVTISQLSSAQEQAKVLSLAKQYEKTQAPQLVDQILKEQRNIAELLPSAITNTTPSRILQLEVLATRQKNLADLWLPLKSKMTQAMANAQQQGGATNAQHFAALNQLMDQTQIEMQEGSSKLRDLDVEGFRSSKIAEHGTYQLWKTVASYDMLLTEDILQQTNTISMTDGSTPADEYTNPIQTQNESAQLTEMFKQRFEKTVPAEGNLQQQSQSPLAPSTTNRQPSTKLPPGPTIANAQNIENSTNAPPQGISAKDRATIVKLAEEAIGQQKQAFELLKAGQTPESLVAQKISHKNLTDIQKLLPKQQNQKQQNKQDQQNNQQQDQKKNQQQDKQQKQDKQQNQQKNQQQDQQKQTKEEQQQAKKETKEEKDIKKLLAKVIEREREHKEEKEKRLNQIPLPAFERDW